MSLLDTLRKSLTPEALQTLQDQLGDDFDYDLVPRARLNKVIKERNRLRDVVNGNSQVSDHDDDDGNESGAQHQQQDKPVDVEALKKQYQKEADDRVNGVKIQFAAINKLQAAEAIDAELIWNGGLIDCTKLTLGEDGQIAGLDEAVTALKAAKPHLFGQTAPSGTGKHEGGNDELGSVKTKADFLKLPYDKQVKFKEANPTLFKTFLSI